jgi:hypothetical protein
MIRFTMFTVLFFLLSQCTIGFSQQWEVEIVRENIVGAWILPGDFDNDDDADLLIQNGDTLLWYENLQLGWSEHLIDTQFLNSSFAGIEVFDLDRDGDLDVLQFPLVNPSSIAWNENKMNGMLWEKHVIGNTANEPGNIVDNYGDLDGDDDIDFAIASFDNGTILWFENVSGDTSWQEHQVANIGSQAIWTTIMDMDRDDDLDIVGARYSAGSIVWYENQLPNTVWTSHSIAALSGTALGLGADMDDDGDPDIVTHSNISNELIWYENPSWAGHAITTGINGLFVGPVGDIDQDGDLDVVFGGQNDIGWCENLGDAQNWQPYIFDTVNNQYPTPAGLADLNSDGYLDVTAYTVFDFRTVTGDARWYANPMTSTSADENRDLGLPTEFTLFQNYPNPFNPETRISYEVAKHAQVMLRVINLRGQQVRTLVNEEKPSGFYEVRWDGNNDHGQRVASGVYLYRLESREFVQTRKMVFLQ